MNYVKFGKSWKSTWRFLFNHAATTAPSYTAWWQRQVCMSGLPRAYSTVQCVRLEPTTSPSRIQLSITILCCWSNRLEQYPTGHLFRTYINLQKHAQDIYFFMFLLYWLTVSRVWAVNIVQCSCSHLTVPYKLSFYYYYYYYYAVRCVCKFVCACVLCRRWWRFGTVLPTSCLAQSYTPLRSICGLLAAYSQVHFSRF